MSHALCARDGPPASPRRSAFPTATIDKHFMIFHHKTTWNQILQIARTTVHLKHAPTGTATEVVVMALARQLIALRLARHIHDTEVMTFREAFQGPVDRRQTHARNQLLRRVQDFLRGEGAILRAEYLANGPSLRGVTLHSAEFLASFNDTLLSLHSEAVFQVHYTRAPRCL